MPSRVALSLSVIGLLSHLWLAPDRGCLEDDISLWMAIFRASLLERLMFS